MFTGIVEEIGVVKAVKFLGTVNKLTVECSSIMNQAEFGDSIAVNGICLTVNNLGKSWFEVDVMPETFRRTSLYGLKPGIRVNLESALKLGGKVGGHIVSGHIDGVGTIREIRKEENARWLIVKAPESIVKYIVMKGSVAVEGTSLTVANVEDDAFGVSLIPTTVSSTVLGEKKVGDMVNIECDIMGKYIEKLLGHKDTTLDINFLTENGFA